MNTTLSHAAVPAVTGLVDLGEYLDLDGDFRPVNEARNKSIHHRAVHLAYPPLGL
jgi:hypothetical protein